VIALPFVASGKQLSFRSLALMHSSQRARRLRGYVFRAYEDTQGDTPGCVRVSLHGKLVHSLATDEAMTYRLGQPPIP